MDVSPSQTGSSEDIQAVGAMIADESAFVHELRTEIAKVVIGQQRMVDRLLIGLLAGGHILLEGVPGLAKTLAVRTVANAVSLAFSRIQFTPDLLPADVIGTQVYDPQHRSFTTHRGPIFANIVLADEINRAPAKVQSALLEAMQEKQVTIGDTSHPLPGPFLVLATQNPIEQEGTYPLAEAQTDRFLMHVIVSYPTRQEEKQIIAQSVRPMPQVSPVIDADRIRRAQQVVRSVYLDEKVSDYIVDVVCATRDPKAVRLRDLDGLIEIGASPRASIALGIAARAHAFLKQRAFVTPEDIKAIGPDILRHRIKLSYEAEAESVTTEDVVRRVFEAVAIP